MLKEIKEVNYWYFYLIRNLVNNKIYVGKRKHRKFENDWTYWGSSKYLSDDIKLIGIENFEKIELAQAWCKDPESEDIEVSLIKAWKSEHQMYNIKLGYMKWNFSDPVYKERNRQAIILAHKNPKTKEKHRQSKKEAWAKLPQEIRDQHIMNAKIGQSSIEAKTKLSRSLKSFWASFTKEELAAKVLFSNYRNHESSVRQLNSKSNILRYQMMSHEQKQQRANNIKLAMKELNLPCKINGIEHKSIRDASKVLSVKTHILRSLCHDLSINTHQFITTNS